MTASRRDLEGLDAARADELEQVGIALASVQVRVRDAVAVLQAEGAGWDARRTLAVERFLSRELEGARAVIIAAIRDWQP